MIDPRTSRIWAYRGLYALLCGTIVLALLLPVELFRAVLPWPDLMLALTFAWLLRRPAYVPPLLIAVVFLLADLLLQRPPGLHSLAVLLATEFLRARVLAVRDRRFGYEWALAGGTMLALMFAERVLAAVVFAGSPPLSGVAVQLGLTILAYPAVVLFSNLIFRVTKAEPGEGSGAGEQA
ncbi:MAG: rod shape-determining protein MreD [Alphaproteobacteria bacterium HGW-Alphaproteobacteria-2]|nr:MAG: rod shape-determining protein MreD [Alphaproteobacteria bacterium HGW-Alphaproteobacteria-2]